MKEDLRKEHQYSKYQNFTFHPYNIMLTLTLFGICMLFLSFSIAFVYSRIQADLPPIKLPSLFIFNTLILLGTSGTMLWAKRAYLQDETENYQRALWATIFLSLIFMVLQLVAWSQLFAQNVFIHSDNSAGYLYLLSALHFVHVIAGLPFLGMFLWAARKKMKEPVSVLVYFSDPEKKLKLRLLTIYWHFLDGLWVYLVLFFWINWMVQ